MIAGRNDIVVSPYEVVSFNYRNEPQQIAAILRRMKLLAWTFHASRSFTTQAGKLKQSRHGIVGCGLSMPPLRMAGYFHCR
jgi:hypothetical protein